MILSSARQQPLDMFQWARAIVIVLMPLTWATNNARMKTFVVNVEDYVRVNTEQAEVIAEYRNDTAALQARVEQLEAGNPCKFQCLFVATCHK